MKINIISKREYVYNDGKSAENIIYGIVEITNNNIGDISDLDMYFGNKLLFINEPTNTSLMNITHCDLYFDQIMANKMCEKCLHMHSLDIEEGITKQEIQYLEEKYNGIYIFIKHRQYRSRLIRIASSISLYQQCLQHFRLTGNCKKIFKNGGIYNYNKIGTIWAHFLEDKNIEVYLCFENDDILYIDIDKNNNVSRSYELVEGKHMPHFKKVELIND